MASEKPNFLSQPVVKNVFMFRNGDPYYEARRIVINQKRVSNFETLLREVTGGIQAPFGAVRNIYTPRGGHKVDSMEGLQSGEQYVAAGRERFKKLDYLHIGLRKRRMLQTLPFQAKPVPQSRIIVSARFLKPIKEPCTIFVVANGDVLNPAVRLLIHQRLLGQFDKILEMITERMGLKVLGGVRSLYTYEGQQVTDGPQLESGQLYVAVGREKFKKLPYSDLLFPKPRGTRRANGVKANSLPPIYRFSKLNGNSKSTTRRSDSGGTETKTSPQGHSGNKEHLSSIVREISQARLLSLRKKRSGQSMTLTPSDTDDQESKANDGNTDDKPPEDQPDEEKPAEDDTQAAEENDKNGGEEGKPALENSNDENVSPDSEADEETNKETTVEEDEEKKENEATEDKADEEPDNEKESKVEEKEGDQKANNDEEGQGAVEDEKKEGEEEVEIEEEVKEDSDEKKEEVTSEEQGPASSTHDKSQDSEEKGDGSHTSSVGEEKEAEEEEEEEEEEGKNTEGQDKDSEDQNNDVDKDKEENKAENRDDPGRTQSDGETKGSDKSRSNSSNSNQEDGREDTKEGAAKESEEEERQENGDGDKQESEAELEAGEKDSAGLKDATTSGEKEEVGGKN